ncbi:transcriptional regulator [Aquabacterium commune]|uniref:ADP/GDP-polyphosphate phosphotransferase n=1 Tax=Aquabacterium commune TaxID=70586 RepID=A0A4R6RHP9_9BURK|nr:polyphosphate kinase 2 [Aquabacterium commune]TDP85880.1 transcriptional regulator [Aquabacterium commune]
MGKQDSKISSKNGGKAKGNQGAPRLGRKDYEAALAPMLLELMQVSRWLAHTNKRLLVIFEGRDTAGKSGVIHAIASALDPRRCEVVALSKPSDTEMTQWYFQRYVPHLPAGGHVALFDRSWYNRAGVEKVMGFCSDEEHERFLREAPLFELSLVNDGMLIFKYWLTVDQAEQEARFAERLADPLKRWKLSPVDVVARTKYAEYGKARNAMLKATHTAHAPWTLVDFNDQRLGRLTLIRHLLDHLPDQAVPEQRFEMPPLKGKPARESFSDAHRPISAFTSPLFSPLDIANSND